ncbi:MAG: SixA phosphatase family protein [Chloroflexota bacterium]
MLLYLVRHAIAFGRDPQVWPDDRERPLTPRGMKRFRRAARGLRRLVPAVDLALSSPYVRAWQTAELLQMAAAWPAPVACEALEAGHPPADVLSALQPHATAGAVALVGHEPGMHELASFLLIGDASRAYVEFKKGGVACFRLENGLDPGAADLLWVAPPRLLRAMAG